MIDRPASGERATIIEAPPPGEHNTLAGLVAAALVIAALYFGREIFVPVALAVLLSFALGPLVSLLRRAHVPRVPAVIAVVLLAFVAIGLFGMLVATQVGRLANNLPSYQQNIEAKIDDLRGSQGGGGVVERASTVLEELSEEISDAEEAPAGGPLSPATASDAEPEPVPVKLEQPDPAPLELLQSFVGPLVAPLATGGIVIVFVIFMLLQREDLRDRFIRLAGSRDLNRTTQAISDAGKRVGHYLLMQLVVNVTYGIPVALGLWIIGVPNPVLWGMLAMVLRFVPYIGPIIAAVFPLALSIAVDPGWSMLLWTALLFIVLELISNNLIEPWLYGSRTGLSPLAIMISAIFWTWLWGPIGLLLSTPLTVCLAVLGQHVPQFAFLSILLGSEPVLTPAEGLYQRLLANDPEEATERAEEFLTTHSLTDFYDGIAIPALALAEYDRARGSLNDERRAAVARGALEIVENLSEHEDIPAVPATPAAAEAAAEEEGIAPPAPPPPAPPPPVRVVCVGARGDLDDAAAAMLAQLLQQRGLGARIILSGATATADLVRIRTEGVDFVCLSYMNTDSMAHARYLIRRLHRTHPTVQVLVGFWTLGADIILQRDLPKAVRADFVAASLKDAADQVDAALQPGRSRAAAAIEAGTPVAA